MKKLQRVWVTGPDLYWDGWKTLLPAQRTHDFFGRWCIDVGTPITGYLTVAVIDCKNPECIKDAEQFRREFLVEENETE